MARRPAAAPRTFRVNHVVGIDLIQLKGFDKRTKEYWLNVVCWGSQFQQVYRVGGDETKSAENIWHAFVAAWIRFMGHPEVLVCDPGLEFQGYFAEMAAA